MANDFLQLFLLVNAFLIGAAVAIAIRHAYAHFRPERHDAERHTQKPVVKLPPEVKQKLLERAEHNFEKILDTTASQLQLDLSRTAASLNSQLDKVGSQIVIDEMKRYRASIDELQRDTEAAVTSTRQALNQHQDELKTNMVEQQKVLVAQMNAEVAAERERRIAQIDSKLADAAASFLIETMQHEVDLGAQAAYLTRMIEAHKEDFKKEVSNESAK